MSTMNTEKTNSDKLKDLDMLQRQVEGCIQAYLDKNETIKKLQTQHAPHLVALVWTTLEQTYPDFFRAYDLRLRIRDQVSYFNSLVRLQAEVAKNVNNLQVQQAYRNQIMFQQMLPTPSNRPILVGLPGGGGSYSSKAPNHHPLPSSNHIPSFHHTPTTSHTRSNNTHSLSPYNNTLGPTSSTLDKSFSNLSSNSSSTSSGNTFATPSGQGDYHLIQHTNPGPPTPFSSYPNPLSSNTSTLFNHHYSSKVSKTPSQQPCSSLDLHSHDTTHSLIHHHSHHTGNPYNNGNGNMTQDSSNSCSGNGNHETHNNGQPPPSYP